MKIAAEDREKILEELTSEFGLGEIEPDEITCGMLAERLGVSPNRANSILNEKVKQGSYTVRYVRSDVGNNRMRAYRKVEDGE
jgi:hypothetical protein